MIMRSERCFLIFLILSFLFPSSRFSISCRRSLIPGKAAPPEKKICYHLSSKKLTINVEFCRREESMSMMRSAWQTFRKNKSSLEKHNLIIERPQPISKNFNLHINKLLLSLLEKYFLHSSFCLCNFPIFQLVV